MNSTKLPSGRLAGVDYGRRRIGISICDAERMIASPLLVHKTTGDRQSDAIFFLTTRGTGRNCRIRCWTPHPLRRKK